MKKSVKPSSEKKSLSAKVSAKTVAKLKSDVAQGILADLNIIKETLLLQKSEILNRNLEFKTAQTTIEKCPDEADSTVQELNNNISIQLHERERKSLYSIDKALSKFAENTYGLCECCGDLIGLKRLQARPLAVFCIACMEETENASRHNSYMQ